MNVTGYLLLLCVVFFTSLSTVECLNRTEDIPRHDPSCLQGGECGEGRTFGVAKRRMMFMLPVVFKLGVIMTLLVGLTVLALKGVTIGVILLIFAFGGIFAKLKGAAHHGQPQSGPVHVHVHGTETSHVQHPPSYSYGSAPWDRGSTGHADASWEDFLARKWAQYQDHSQQHSIYDRNLQMKFK